MAEQMMQDAAVQAIPAGYKQTEVGVIPEDWSVNLLGDLCSLKSGLGITSKDIDDSGSYRCFGGNGLRGYTKNYTHDGDYALIGRQGALCGNIQYVSGKFFASEHALVASAIKSVSAKWLSIYLDRMNLNQYSESSAQPGLSAEKLRILKLITPTSEEQTAIANVLSDSDALIGALEQLIAKKQAIKSATMQQLLTGRTRLPAFALRPDGTLKGYKPSELGYIPEDWEVNPLGALLKERPRYGINAPAVPLTGDTPVYIRITDISDDGYFNPSEKVGVSSPFSGMYFLSDGDIVLARTGASVGKSYLYNKNDGQLVYAGFLIKISPNQERLSSIFLSQYLKLHQYWNWVVVNSMRSGQPGINGSEYASLLIPTPTIEEQTAIATILSDMDNELQVLTQKLEKARALKQGMMQQLLTGKIRLPLEASA
jgi:type I restriction enzyme, S subunit